MLRNQLRNSRKAHLLCFGPAKSFLPAINEVPSGFPANVLWPFRLASWAFQLLLWTSIAQLFAADGTRPSPEQLRNLLEERSSPGWPASRTISKRNVERTEAYPHC
ncbi:CbtA family protein [Granulicella arctica]|uniref:CbtA family protein n=1 Tax=Granulicella arctica TaxID=940613 RepID=UPI0037BE7AFC